MMRHLYQWRLEWRFQWRLALLAAMLLNALPAFADEACGKIPVTPEKAEWLGRDLVINGMQTDAAMMTFDASTDTISSQFRAFWQKEGAAARAIDTGHELLLSAIDKTCSYTLDVPVHANSPVTGLFSAARLSNDTPALPRALQPSAYPLPEGETVLDMVSHDSGSDARTVQMKLHDSSPERAAQSYAQRLVQQGWREVAQGSAMQPRSAAASGYALAMQKGGLRMDAAFSRQDGSTTAVINVSAHS